MMKNVFLFLLLIAQCFFVQSQSAPDFKQHIVFLASDSLHGRYIGSKDEEVAADYIIRQFQKDDIPNVKGNLKEKNYLQTFSYSPTTDSIRFKWKGKNVVAFLDNHADHTVVLGAHYDHLGMGDPHFSAYRGEPAVHNGADDNASGVAMIIELAKRLKNYSLKNNNYLIIAFSGEEEGLLGSKWFVTHPMVDMQKVNYMLNFDMVGRLDSNRLIVNGVGTSPEWIPAMKRITTSMHIKTTESGIGPSDHTSFYLNNIPVLHFFSGQHHDYHKPSDDEYKINYPGMNKIFDYVMALISNLNNKGKLEFNKTKEEKSEDTPRFTVTLGVMPDYTFEGQGMRIDAITNERPASKAGLLDGDVVIQLGEVKVTDMMSYMKALSAFKKGDTTKVKVKRGNEIIEKDVHF